MTTNKTLTPHQEQFIRDTVAKWCDQHFPQMTECDFVQICEVKHQFHFKLMLDNTHLGKRSSEWQVPKSLIKASAKWNFEQMAQTYKDAGQFGRRPSDIAIEQSVEESFRPFFNKNK